MADRRQKKAHRGLTEGYKGLEMADRMLKTSLSYGKVRDTQFTNHITDFTNIRERGNKFNEKVMSELTMPVSFSGDVLCPKKRRHRHTLADTGCVTVTDRRSL